MLEPRFFTAKTVKPKDRSQIVSIRTGLSKVDKAIIGLNKQETSCLSGSSGGGKSSVASQIAIEVVNDGRKVALFSGELSENRVLEWLQLQAAGKAYTNSTQYENYFYVKPEVKEQINGWLDQKLFIYNNQNGAKVETILDGIQYCIETQKVDLVIMDNLMSMDLSSLSFDKLERQTMFALKLSKFAKVGDVHCLFIAHPKKALGFLRKDDISGTADLTNAADNVFIMHRVNEDFKRLGKINFGWHPDDPIYGYDNVIEICKNRDLGVQDYMAGLFFERESKRFNCEKYVSKTYRWVDGTIYADDEIKSPFDL